MKDALSLHYQGLVADSAPLAQSRGVDVYLDDPVYAGGAWAVADFAIGLYLGKAIRFNATFLENLLGRIDEVVQKDHGHELRSVHIPAHRDRPFRLNVTACSGLS